nr:hypothetical protein [Streptomyces polyasparticus]
MSWMLLQAPEPKLKDRETGEAARDRDSGKVLFNVSVALMMQDAKPDALVVVVAEDGLQQDLMPGMPVEFPGLVARPWEAVLGGRPQHGISLRAIAVTAKTPAPAASNGKG